MYTSQLEQVEEYARYRKLPLAMKQKVYEYYYQRYHGHMFNEQDILNELSHPLMVVGVITETSTTVWTNTKNNDNEKIKGKNNLQTTKRN